MANAIRYVFNRVLTTNEVTLLREFISRPGSTVTMKGDQVRGCTALPADVADFQQAMKSAGCSVLHISVAELAKAK